jgi:putative lipoprotein
VSLSLESGIITAQGRYGVAAAIWSGDAQIFRTMRRYTVVEGSRLPLETVELLLLMVQEDVESAPPPRRIAGVSWAVTEVLGRPTATEDPATLVIDSDMNFSLFGGCNRFNGRLIPTEDGVAFPETFAGTLMACPPGIEASERRLLEALRRVTGYVRYGGGLVMTDAQRAAVLHLEARPD